MTPELSKTVTAINYLTGGLVIPDGTCPISDSETLGRKIGVSTDLAIAFELTLVGAGLIRPAPGYFNTPRYYITDAGRTFVVMTKSYLRAWTPDQILTRLPERSVFAGNYLSIYNAFLVLIEAGLVSTDDGGASFTFIL